MEARGYSGELEGIFRGARGLKWNLEG